MTKLYKGLPINTGDNDQYPMNAEVLECIYQQFDRITSKYPQVFIVRFDLHLPPQSQLDPLAENRLVSEFFRALVQKKLKRGKAAHKCIAYTWVREVEKSKKAHYHCWIAVDKHKLDRVGSLQKKTGLYGLMLNTWIKVSGGGHVSISPLAVNGIKVTCEEEKSAAFYALSYLAKARGKGVRHGTKVRDFGGARV